MTYSNTPSRERCVVANPGLWAEFCSVYSSRFFFPPMFDHWTEEDCQYWLDCIVPELDELAILEQAESVYDYYAKFDKPVVL